MAIPIHIDPASLLGARQVNDIAADAYRSALDAWEG